MRVAAISQETDLMNCVLGFSCCFMGCDLGCWVIPCLIHMRLSHAPAAKPTSARTSVCAKGAGTQLPTCRSAPLCSAPRAHGVTLPLPPGVGRSNSVPWRSCPARQAVPCTSEAFPTKLCRDVTELVLLLCLML